MTDDDHDLSAELKLISDKLLPELEGRFDNGNGDKHALLRAIFLCMVRGSAVPMWARLGFANAFTEVSYYAKGGSWDDVFGKPWPKGHLPQAQRRAALRLHVWQRVRQLHDVELMGLGDSLFDQVGAEFELGRRQAKAMYYRVERALPPKDRALARKG